MKDAHPCLLYLNKFQWCTEILRIGQMKMFLFIPLISYTADKKRDHCTSYNLGIADLLRRCHCSIKYRRAFVIL